MAREKVLDIGSQQMTSFRGSFDDMLDTNYEKKTFENLLHNVTAKN